MKRFYFYLAIIFIIIFQFNILSQNGWFQQSSGTTQVLNSISVINENTAFVCGESGVILNTSNGGLNWVQQASNFTNNISDIFFIDAQTGWACGGISNYPNIGMFSVLRTTNGGNNWSVLFNTYSVPGYYISSFNNVYLINSQTGFVSISRTNGIYSLGHVLYTTNGGVNWLATGPNLSNGDINFFNQNTGFLLSGYWDDTGKETCYVYKSTDIGSSWNMIYKYSGFNFKQASFINMNTGWISGTRRSSGSSFDGVVFKTVNGGLNWDYTTIISAYSIYSVSFPSNDTGYICGPGIYRTTNGGINWVQQLNPLTIGNKKIKMINSKTGWCVGFQGVILKTNTAGINAIKKISEQVPDKFNLYQNYPNPFNPITNVRFSIPKSNVSVNLVIYDALGKKVSELVNEKLAAGIYETEWDASNYSSGIYYYRLVFGDNTNNGGYSETKKMVLIK